MGVFELDAEQLAYVALNPAAPSRRCRATTPCAASCGARTPGTSGGSGRRAKLVGELVASLARELGGVVVFQASHWSPLLWNQNG